MKLEDRVNGEIKMNLTQLTDNRDTLRLDNGKVLRLRIQPCEYTNPFSDFGCYGEVSHNKVRPAGFNGNSEKLSTRDSGSVWWQPPRSVNLAISPSARAPNGTVPIHRLLLTYTDVMEQYAGSWTRPPTSCLIWCARRDWCACSTTECTK